MKPAHIQILGIAITLAGFVFIGFLYWTEPRSFAEVATKSQVAIGSYQVDRTELARGIDLFRKEDFIGARVALDRADPEKRDAQTQFYVAYSFYRQGWGRLSNDDALFQSGIEAANRVIALDANFRSTDETLGLKTPTELKNELEEGLKITPSDFNPMRLTRERK
jgi:hypothetical protein